MRAIIFIIIIIGLGWIAFRFIGDRQVTEPTDLSRGQDTGVDETEALRMNEDVGDVTMDNPQMDTDDNLYEPEDDPVRGEVVRGEPEPGVDAPIEELAPDAAEDLDPTMDDRDLEVEGETDDEAAEEPTP